MYGPPLDLFTEKHLFGMFVLLGVGGLPQKARNKCSKLYAQLNGSRIGKVVAFALRCVCDAENDEARCSAATPGL